MKRPQNMADRLSMENPRYWQQYREKLRALLERESFSSYMSDTKWMALIHELWDLDLPLRYRRKLITDPDISRWGFSFARTHEPYIELDGLGPELALEYEWLEIDVLGPSIADRPDENAPDFEERYESGASLARKRDKLWPNLVDYSAEIASLLERLKIFYSKEGTIFRVIGHQRRG